MIFRRHIQQIGDDKRRVGYVCFMDHFHQTIVLKRFSHETFACLMHKFFVRLQPRRHEEPVDQASRKGVPAIVQGNDFLPGPEGAPMQFYLIGEVIAFGFERQGRARPRGGDYR